MKKALVALFVVLMLFAFVGCANDKVEDKSEEMVQTFVNFMETASATSNVVGCNWELAGEESVDLSEQKYDDENPNLLTSIVKSVTGYETVIEITKNAGKVSYSKEGGGSEDTMLKEVVSAKDIDIECTLKDSEGESKEFSIKFSIEFEREYKMNEDGKTGMMWMDIKSFTLNGNEYKPVSAKVEISVENKTYKILSAKWNGKDVNLDLLNATTLIML